MCRICTCLASMLQEEKMCWPIHIVDYHRRNIERRVKESARMDLNLPPRPDPLTQAAQHKCCNPPHTTSNTNKAFTQHNVAHVPPSTWNYCAPLTQLYFRAWTQTVLCHNPPSASGSRPTSFSGIYFTPDRIMGCLEVSSGAPILVFACVCAGETVRSFCWPT